VKQITVRKDVTINTGNFTNIKLGAEITADYDPNDEFAWGKAWKEVQSQIAEQEMIIKATHSKPEKLETKDKFTAF